MLVIPIRYVWKTVLSTDLNKFKWNTAKRHLNFTPTVAILHDISYLSRLNTSAKLEDSWLEESVIGLGSSTIREHKYTKSDHVWPCIIVPVQLRTNEWNLQQTQQATAEDLWLQTWMVMIKSDIVCDNWKKTEKHY